MRPCSASSQAESASASPAATTGTSFRNNIASLTSKQARTPQLGNILRPADGKRGAAPSAAPANSTQISANPMASRSRLLLVGRSPAPGAGSEAAGDDALAVDVGYHVAVAAEQRLGRAHLRTARQLAPGPPVENGRSSGRERGGQTV